jgi:hypothetical protein
MARNGFEISMKWKGGKITEARIFSRFDGDCKIKYCSRTVSISTKKGKILAIGPEMFEGPNVEIDRAS